MDEDKKVAQNNIAPETKESVQNQIDSYINPNSQNKDNVTAIPNIAIPEKIPEPLIKVADIPTPPKQNRPIIRTYKSDVEETIQTGHLSSVNIALAENKKMLEQAKRTEIETKKSGVNKTVIIISLILIFGGALAFFIPQFLINVQYGQKTTPAETFSSKPIMTVDAEDKINIGDINLSRVATTLKERVDQAATRLGQLKNIYLTEGTGTAEKLITASKFLNLIGADVPSEIQVTLKNPYMFGTYTYNGNQRFLILKVGSYDTTFAGMFSWEANLLQNFTELFGLNINNGVSGTSSEMQTGRFQDAMFDNKDCRVVKDASGKIIFLYSIIDQNTIVITTSTDTLTEIINRISKARVVTQ